MSDKKDLNGRREFIKKMALGVTAANLLSPLELILRSTIYGHSMDAIASIGGFNTRKFLYIQQHHAPARWLFDLPIAMDNTDWNIMNKSNKGLATRMVGTSTAYNDCVYETWTDPKSGLRLPWMWQFRIPSPGGQTRPVTDLLNNMLVLRGVNVINPEHQAAALLHFHPAGLAQSITSLAADHSTNPIPCINTGSLYHSFKSTTGKSHVDIPRNGTKQIESLLEPFQRLNLPNITPQKSLVRDAVKSAMAVFDDLAIEQHFGLEAGVSSRVGAEEMIASSITANGQSEFLSLRNKYEDLIKRSLAGTYTGINDRPVTGTAQDLRTNGTTMNVTDLRSCIVAGTTISNLSAHMATAEFILTRNISNSVVISPGNLTGLKLPSGSSFNSDSHASGKIACTFFFSMYSIAFASCLAELTDSLVRANIFDETVIDFSGEFGRNPRADDGASDHSPQANSNTFFSGAIQGPHFLGNVRVQQPGSTTIYGGTYGYQGDNPTYGYLNYRHFTATLSAMLRAENPVSSPPLVKEQNGVLVPLMPRGKIVSS